MDYEIQKREQLKVETSDFLKQLKEKGYSDTTISGYRACIFKSWDYLCASGKSFNSDTVNDFIKLSVPCLPYSEDYRRHFLTSLRRFGSYLCGKPYEYRVETGAAKPPDLYRSVLDAYLSSMSRKGMRSATISVRKIFATQFLNSIYYQGVKSLEFLTGEHVGAAILSAGSVSGMCQKLPHFLKYLKTEGLTKISLEHAVPKICEEKHIPTVYRKEELISLINSIDQSNEEGKRDFAIIMLLVTYGLRATDLINLTVSDIDLVHNLISFKQSKTGRYYKADLIHSVKNAISAYILVCPSKHNEDFIFKSVYAPFDKLSRSGLWSIVSTRLDASVNTGNRKKGSHAIRSSIASNLVADKVPYPIVQEILGHEDANATKRYVAIDVERLRERALECLPASGLFLSYMEGGCWK